MIHAGAQKKCFNSSSISGRNNEPLASTEDSPPKKIIQSKLGKQYV